MLAGKYYIRFLFAREEAVNDLLAGGPSFLAGYRKVYSGRSEADLVCHQLRSRFVIICFA
jgi:hypothetical protein